MQITKVTVSAGRTFNHPFEQYSNLRPHVTLEASVDDGEDPLLVARKLQAHAETLIEDHKQHLLSSIERLEDLRAREREKTKLESLITNSQQRLASLRAEPDAQQVIDHDFREDEKEPF